MVMNTQNLFMITHKCKYYSNNSYVKYIQRHQISCIKFKKFFNLLMYILMIISLYFHKKIFLLYAENSHEFLAKA